MRQLTPIKAIRKTCLDCCSGSPKSVKLCSDTECPLHIYRFGKNPRRKGIAPNKHLFQKNPTVVSRDFSKERASNE